MEGDALSDLPQPEYEGTVAPDSLTTDGDNPNEMTDEQFGLLCDRLRQNGWLGGPIITTDDGLIADGEHRWRAAQEIGLAEVPVRQFDIDDATRRLWRQELNKIHGEHDEDADRPEFQRIIEAGKETELNQLLSARDEDLDELLDTTEATPGIGEAEPLGLDEEYEVIVECNTEQDQEKIYQELTQEGYECRLNSM
jgi:ParB-like chromosome segregation protein Spo0J